MISQIELEREVLHRIDSAISDGRVVIASWLVKEIVDAHQCIAGDDSDWYRHCAFHHVRATVQKTAQRYKLKEDGADDRSLVLPGFERVQTAYLVKRDGEQQVIPTPQLTAREIKAKIKELHQMASGCEQHADELGRYLEKKFRAVA